MEEIRRLEESDLATAAKISARAYPAMGVDTDADLEAVEERDLHQFREDPQVEFYGAFRGDTMVGVMRLYNFEINFHGQMLPAGGIGGVGVDVAHKKEKVALNMVRWYLRYFRDRPLAILYSFRPDFYRRMGFGFGTVNYEMRIRPESLPEGSRTGITALVPEDVPSILKCYNASCYARHGMIPRPSEFQLRNAFKSHKNILMGYREDGKLLGYVAYAFTDIKDSNFTRYDLRVVVLIYQNPRALAALLAHLRSQADQVERILLNTQDEHLFYLLEDPRVENAEMLSPIHHEIGKRGVGLMYRASDVPTLLESLKSRDFGGVTLRLRFHIDDELLGETSRTTVDLSLINGQLQTNVEIDPEVEITLPLSEFSSLIMGCIGFDRLYAYGLAQISEVGLKDTVDRALRFDNRPQCVIGF